MRYEPAPHRRARRTGSEAPPRKEKVAASARIAPARRAETRERVTELHVLQLRGPAARQLHDFRDTFLERFERRLGTLFGVVPGIALRQLEALVVAAVLDGPAGAIPRLKQRRPRHFAVERLGAGPQREAQGPHAREPGRIANLPEAATVQERLRMAKGSVAAHRIVL